MQWHNPYRQRQNASTTVASPPVVGDDFKDVRFQFESVASDFVCTVRLDPIFKDPQCILDAPLQEMMGKQTATRPEVVQFLWDYIEVRRRG
jgi:SWIB/MDM2 domain